MFGHPHVTPDNFKPDSPQCALYNCLAWALHNQDLNIWPDPYGQYSWPSGLPRDDSIDVIIKFLQSLHFVRASDEAYEVGIEKIAIYANNNGPQHVARQDAKGIWNSKLGILIDAKHTSLSALEGGSYGNVVCIMQRVDTGQSPTLPEMFPPKPKLIGPGGKTLVP